MNKILLFLILIFTVILGTQQSLSYILDNDQSGFFSLDTASSCPNNHGTELLAGDIVSGKITTKYSNFGILAVRFYNYDRDSDDILSFRIKPIDSESWYYQAEYKTDQFQPHQHFPFGFPIIRDSKNKTYQYEIESLKGEEGKGITIDCQAPPVMAKSVFTQNDFPDTKTLAIFLVSKTISVIADPAIRSNLFVFYSPAIFLLVHLLLRKHSYLTNLLTVLIMSVVDILIINTTNSYLIFSILFFWVLTAIRFRIDPRVYLLFSILLLSAVPAMLIFDHTLMAEKTSIWVYLLLVISVTQMIYQSTSSYKPRVTLNQFYRKLFHKQ